MLQGQQLHLHPFGANDHPNCPDCGGRMSVIRRTPHSGFGSGYQLQRCVCLECRHETERSADAEGRPHA